MNANVNNYSIFNPLYYLSALWPTYSESDIPSTKYDAYFIENKTGQEFPEKCCGAIGITLDDQLIGIKHKGLNVFNKISTQKNEIGILDTFHSINLTNLMHAFVITSPKNPRCVKVCEAIGKGFVSADIKIGDWDWTSMVLFVPKDPILSNKLMLNAMQELKADEKGNVSSYGYLEGIQSVLTKKNLVRGNMSIIASEMADLIKFRSIRDETGAPKSCICSQLAMRVVRSSVLMTAIPEEKLSKYRLLSKSKLEEKLVKKLSKEDSPLNKVYNSSNLFAVPADVNTLPYELYLALKKDSELH